MKIVRVLSWVLRAIVAAALFVVAAGATLVAARLFVIGGSVADAMTGFVDKAMVAVFSFVIVGLVLGVAGLIYGIGRRVAGEPRWIPRAGRLVVLLIGAFGVVVSAVFLLITGLLLAMTTLTWSIATILGERSLQALGRDTADFENRAADFVGM